MFAKRDANKAVYLTPKTCPRRPGTDDSGREYELKITALLSLRCATMEDTEDMWVGSNVDRVGDFDDVVLSKRTIQGKHRIYLIQLKHQENPKNIARHDFTYSAESKGKKNKSKGDFSLSKYSAGFLELKSQLCETTESELEVIQCLRKADKVVFVLYTNKGVDNCEFLECVTDISLAFLNTGGTQQYSYSFDPTKLDHDSDFLQQLLLICNQVHISQTDNLIKNEIKRILGTSKITNVDFEDATKDFMEFIKTWAKGVQINKKGNLKICYTLNKRDVINVLTAILLKPYTLDFSKDSYGCPKVNLWNKIVRDVTVAVVDFDDGVVEFLKRYIGGEVGLYCEEAKNTWMEHLSKAALDSFYQKHSKLNNQILRITESDKKLTLFDLYQNLWFNSKLPLLLTINDTKSYNDVMRILKISNYNLRVIIINRSNLLLPISKLVANRLITLSDLSVENREQVLDNLIRLQGRSSVVLKGLVDDSMYEYFSSNDIIHILLNDFSIGNEYEPLGDYFIQRSLFKIFLKPSVLSSIKDEVFVVQTQNGDDLLKNKFNGFALVHKGNDNVVFITKQDLMLIQNLKSKGAVVHRLIFHNEKLLEWKESYGGTGNIRKYQQNTSKVWESLEKTIKEDASNSLGATLRIISATPGMGKSTLLDYIAHSAPTNLWVLKINLLDHDEYYKNKKRKFAKLSANDHIKYFNDAIFKKNTCRNPELAQAIFEKFLETKQILLLLDGFDEISITYKDEVTQMVKCLHEGGFPVWLTTRPHMKTHLENQLSTLSTTLKPFSTKDQEHFLYKYFTKVTETSGHTENRLILKKFVAKLLRVARRNLSHEDCEFTGVPLQTKLLADVFSEAFTASLDRGAVHFQEHFNLFYLYEEFLNRKTRILCEKFGKGSEQLRILFREHQQLFALKTVFMDDHLWELNIDEQLHKYYKNIHELQFLQQEGIVVIEEGERAKRFNFVHRTFAEYSAAQWLSEQFDSECIEVKRTARKLLIGRFNFYSAATNFLFRIFDCILAKDCPSHMLIINGQVEEAKTLIRDNPDVLDSTDEGGRTVLHLIAIYGLREPVQHTLSVIEDIPNHKITNFKDEILGCSALDYALAKEALPVANKMCEKSGDLVIGINLADFLNCHVHSIITSCKFVHYKSLCKKLLLHLICEELLNNEHHLIKNQDVITFCDNFSRYGTTSKRLRRYCLAEIKEKTISQFLEAMNIASSTEPDYYNNLQFAVAFGTEDNVLQLLSSADTHLQMNKEDTFGNTLLHYAVLKQRPEMVNILLGHGADVNQPGRCGDTPIHCAAKNSSEKIMKTLLTKQPKINKLNDRSMSPLHLAVQNDNIQTVKLLLDHGADVNQADVYSNAPIHDAAINSRCNAILIMQELLTKNPDVNQQTETGNTPLHLGLAYDDNTVAKLLLSSSADCNIQNSDGDFPLHTAALHAAYAVIKEILSKTVDKYNKNQAVNIKNNDYKTPLHLSVYYSDKLCFEDLDESEHNHELDYRIKTVTFLLNNGADVNSQDLNGNTALHWTSQYKFLLYDTDQKRLFYNTATLLLLNNGADVNLLNKNGKSALDLATKSKNTEITSLIRQKIANPRTQLINASETNISIKQPY